MNLLKTSGLALLCASSLGCVSIFHAMSRDFHAEAGIVSPAAENSYEAETEVKVISYNIAHCRGKLTYPELDDLDQDLTIDSPEQVYKCLDAIANMLIGENAGIALLQEVDRKAVWSYDIDFTPYLAEKAGMRYYAYGPRYDFVWWPYEHQRANGAWIDTVYFDMGNAVLSKYPIISAENKAFDSQGFIDWIAGEERYLDTVIDIQGKGARVISVHLDADDAEIRERESRRLVDDVRGAALPTIIGGDFNAILRQARCHMPGCDPQQQNDESMQILLDSGLFNFYMADVDPRVSSYYTSNTTDLFRTVDYILPTSDIEIMDYYVVDVELSDHKPVAAVLRLTDSQ